MKKWLIGGAIATVLSVAVVGYFLLTEKECDCEDCGCGCAE